MNFSNKSQFPVPSLIQVLTAIILQNLADKNFNTIVLADKLGMSDRHLNRKLKEQDDLTASQLIREVRLEEARKILEGQSRSTISAVCADVGFSKPGYFSKIYEARFGIRPAEYFNRNKS